ncbi:DUF563 domain-containing protein [Synechococcus sp. CBW1108]|uniref:glycosyltransferase family 61 protein n=1 Tax=Synechococcus sp. CBW1108 TaxID=1353147 RepID=UPI0018CCF93E|nr:glycosyltransferase family 61 protein [Synechococcus sp. CBW1108]QPN69511.1 glycosyltransferase family 61 protein [Synechococcus sp. CBW1108]
MTTLYSSSFCCYTLRNPLNSPLGRLESYLTPFTAKPFEYHVVKSGQLVSLNLYGLTHHWRLLPDTYPFFNPRLRDRLIIRSQSLLPSTLNFDVPLCSLLDVNQWHYSYFHWFIDILPRLLSVCDYQAKSGNFVYLLVPLHLKEWQVSSLGLLGFTSSSLINLDQNIVRTSILTSSLISSPAGRAQGLLGAPYDCMSPNVITKLADNLSSGTLYSTIELETPKKLYISRKDALCRRTVNEDEVVCFLERYGYVSVTLDGLPLPQLIALFQKASHIIAVHGAGLTNLLFSENATVVELHAEGHGIRADYFQLASIKGLKYFYYVFPSFNTENDIVVDIKVLETLLYCVT